MDVSAQTKGIAAVLLACTIWGLSPIFYKEVVHIPPLEVLAHRTLWSLAFFLVYIAVCGRLGEIPQAFAKGQVWIILLAALMVSANWGLFILATQIDRVTEASLGYFIFPLFAVLLGRFWFQEHLTRLQWSAVLVATVGVCVLTTGLGVAPWLSLVLASTFAVYSAIKKGVKTGPVLSVTCEVILFLPFTLVVLIYAAVDDVAGPSARDMVFLILSGPLTAGPLMLYSYAAKRTSMVAMGVLQFVNPMLQFFCAVVLFSEPFTGWHSASFLLIWVALVLYSIALVRQERSARNVAMASSIEPATDTKARKDPSAKP